MVFMVDGVKYACASCIRGHRVKKCNHSNRPLIRIQKRGRQVSQCTHCRDLRKSNKSHIKCTCATSSTLPNPVNGCLCQVIPVCNCVACHLQDMKAEDNNSLKPCTASPNSTPSPSVSSHSISSTQSLVSPADLSHTVEMPDTMNTELLPEPASENPVAMNEFKPSMFPNDMYYNDSIFVKEDAELIDFLFNDLDKFLTPNTSPTVAPQLI